MQKVYACSNTLLTGQARRIQTALISFSPAKVLNNNLRTIPHGLNLWWEPFISEYMNNNA